MESPDILFKADKGPFVDDGDAWQSETANLAKKYNMHLLQYEWENGLT